MYVISILKPHDPGDRGKWISVNSRPAWSTEQVQDRLQSYRETLSQRKKKITCSNYIPSMKAKLQIHTFE